MGKKTQLSAVVRPTSQPECHRDRPARRRYSWNAYICAKASTRVTNADHPKKAENAKASTGPNSSRGTAKPVSTNVTTSHRPSDETVDFTGSCGQESGASASAAARGSRAASNGLRRKATMPTMRAYGTTKLSTARRLRVNSDSEEDSSAQSLMLSPIHRCTATHGRRGVVSEKKSVLGFNGRSTLK